ncbi:hypothetical protein N476_15075 [Pseudoalteromonas luteoviolacea H33]|uniref:Uncharacterized protein n=1 Tax=Pseudoalteromonas luteoviolacea H33 TaxID=1365251 RepID=A0A167EJ42_9GAMM|nr:hypothetical protein N476_15075 [Pseudoalteromonas luteoviolacea H33]KZN74839.1 hypothetical protein N477_21250 [Pseudoalteromonas luteoviolacea H33-S]
MQSSMSKVRRFLYIVEFVLAFGPSFIVLVLALIFSPALLLGLDQDILSKRLIFVLIILGFGGFWGAISLIGLTLFPFQENTKPTRLKLYIMPGVIASTMASFYAGTMSLYLLPVFIAPLLMTLQLVIKQRYYFST